MSAEDFEHREDPSMLLEVENSASEEASVYQRTRNWASSHKWQLALAGIGVSLGLTLTSDNTSETLNEAKENLPAVAAGMVAMETMWIGGAAMMAASVGDKLKNPLKIKARFPEIAERANDSKLFTAGFWTNTAGAVGEFAIPAAVVFTKLPPETWGVLGPSTIDLGITLAVRKAILSSVRSASEYTAADSVTKD